VAQHIESFNVFNMDAEVNIEKKVTSPLLARDDNGKC